MSNIYDTSGTRVGMISQGGQVYDTADRRVGEISGSSLYNARGETVGRVSGVDSVSMTRGISNTSTENHVKYGEVRGIWSAEGSAHVYRGSGESETKVGRVDANDETAAGAALLLLLKDRL